jgi:CRISPR-associated endonuclease/helicase Cas3
MLEEILAKSKPEVNPETLVQHTDNLISCWLLLRNRYQGIIGDNDQFWFDCFIAILFHDFGKLSQNFQEMIRKSLKKSALNPKLEPIRHEFLSGMLLAYHAVDIDRKRQDIQPNYAQLFAIFTHHKDFTNTLFDCDIHRQWEIKESDFFEFISYVTLRINKYYPEEITYLNNIETAWSWLREDTNSMETLYTNKYDLIEVETLSYRKHNGYSHRKKYLLQKAILVISDWSASGHRSLEEPLSYNYDYLFEKVKLKLGDRFLRFRDFQMESSRAIGNVLAIAPRGSGKTEAALLWASRRTFDFQRIVYLLPTKITANAIYKRMNGYFGKASNGVDDYTAVVHS